ncbi:uncharacterized protein BT62DRAFT_1007185 [Guyanagaster necrorhizus]|uniref:Uncharacterized protein n=1 Tax=Guyanagaster necrorhizus TaxID=856835 RepID=A0A9P7VRP3_9AGAR|nr:uncharacterized protein BT62DRAFT_1007185 [Guyanagaster necrorhizus MCA 3950]KAG7445433.1 hypothetical protein BT62DRAFT_1007185 [Guyanagaster necrorhizus MCA 3950]
MPNNDKEDGKGYFHSEEDNVITSLAYMPLSPWFLRVLWYLSQALGRIPEQVLGRSDNNLTLCAENDNGGSVLTFKAATVHPPSPRLSSVDMQYAFHYGGDLGEEPHRIATPPADFDPTTSALSPGQSHTIAYRFISSTNYLIIYKTMFEYTKDPGEMRIWQLENDEWADCTEDEGSGSVSLRCLGCSTSVAFDAWEAHRDACLGIEDKMLRAVMADMLNEEESEGNRKRCSTIRSVRESVLLDAGYLEGQRDERGEARKRKSLGMRLCSGLHFIGLKHSKE